MNKIRIIVILYFVRIAIDSNYYNNTSRYSVKHNITVFGMFFFYDFKFAFYNRLGFFFLL